MNTAETVVLRFGDAVVPRALGGLPVVPIAAADDVDAQLDGARRLVVLGGDTALATVLGRLLRAERLDIEVAPVVGRLLGHRSARRAVSAPATPTPLIRDETGTVLVAAATWRGADGPLHGEAVVDDAVLFDGQVAGVRIEPLDRAPGVRAAVLGGWRRRWLEGRAAQLGTTGALVVRDGVAAPRPVRRSTFYRHIVDWLAVR